MIIRDERSKALLNTDIESLNKYKRERERHQKMEKLCEEMKEVKIKIDEILKLIEKNT